MKKALIFSVIILAAACILVFLNKDLIPAYYNNARYNHFKYGDKLYIASDHSMELMLLIKPIDPASSKKPYLIDLGWQINIDSAKKYHTRCIGTYMHNRILNFNSNESYPRLNFYAIKPDKKLIDKYGVSDSIPKDFELAQAPFYIPFFSVSNKN